MNSVLLVVDVQRDFCAGGALAALDTDSLIEPLNRLLGCASAAGIQSIFTRDWHPNNHRSFSVNGGTWPIHCVKGTTGAAFASGLVLPVNAEIVDKGRDSNSEGYSGFEHTDLGERLARSGVRSIGVCGIATEYCVLATVEEAIQRGFGVSVLTDLIRPVEAKQGDSSVALERMQRRGAQLATGVDWLSEAVRN